VLFGLGCAAPASVAGAEADGAGVGACAIAATSESSGTCAGLTKLASCSCPRGANASFVATCGFEDGGKIDAST
jgi:hypothetical protein